MPTLDRKYSRTGHPSFMPVDVGKSKSQSGKSHLLLFSGLFQKNGIIGYSHERLAMPNSLFESSSYLQL